MSIYIMHKSIPGVTPPPPNLPDRQFTVVGNLPVIYACTGAGYCLVAEDQGI